MAEREKLRIAIVSGAAHALKYKRDNPRASDDEAIQHVTREMSQIIQKVNAED